MTGDLAGTTALVVGAGRGLGHGIAAALAGAGSAVTGISRRPPARPTPGVHHEQADAADPAGADRLLDQHQPDVLVLVAGAGPVLRPLQEQTWETFSVNWHADVRIAFTWLRAALLRPMPRGGRVVVLSSGAALAGSPLSGGYAGAKATQRLITGYAQEESDRAGLGLAFTAVLPRLTPATELGAAAVAAYVARTGLPEDEYLRRLGGVLTPEGTGAAVVSLLTTATGDLAPAYVLGAAGLDPLR
ncbi:Putative L-xylulose reductase [Modestobacter italicus]|uniref:L-xylulose reductase n=1 Tax=Modestobacter italicus (strain DSM 44449 / CECT 9708 / BC 501) TaxID=2732864 RepID=I4F0B1_MODI5|nr:SDR family NAD(P)-dependent oxidoreductase [Modestobacter marinus]CCH89074.1 Putative L-xylulose reductase [Modestobacter marinus]